MTRDTRKVVQVEGQVGMDMPIPPTNHGEYIYRCTRCHSSNIPLDSVSPSVDPRWVLARCLDCSYNIATKHPIPQQEEPDDSGTQDPR